MVKCLECLFPWLLLHLKLCINNSATQRRLLLWANRYHSKSPGLEDDFHLLNMFGKSEKGCPGDWYLLQLLLVAWMNSSQWFVPNHILRAIVGWAQGHPPQPLLAGGGWSTAAGAGHWAETHHSYGSVPRRERSTGKGGSPHWPPLPSPSPGLCSPAWLVPLAAEVAALGQW